jgi:hypothetical protein
MYSSSMAIIRNLPDPYQPTHPGHMAQFGLNAGARHVCALGQAKSYTKDLDQGTRINHDTDVIGAVSITWSLIRSVMPIEVLGEVDRALELDGMPRLATRDVCESKLFSISYFLILLFVI